MATRRRSARSPSEDLVLEDTSASDPASARLGRLLVYYRERLRDDERQVMGWLAAVTRGLAVRVLAVLARTDREVAGVMVGANDARLVGVLERPRELGLVFRFGEGAELRYSAHPFVRDHLRVLLGVPAERVFRVVREELGKGLERRPGSKPTDAAVLDRYEEWIEATREAGDVQGAFDLYWYAFWGFAHLGKGIGEYARGRRILDGFAGGEGPAAMAPGLRPRDRSFLVGDWGLFRDALGDLDGALACHLHGIGLDAARELSRRPCPTRATTSA